MNGILADVFPLYLKTKNFHWHMSGPHFRDYHVMLDEQSDQIYAMTDPIAERIRKVGGSTLRSIGHIIDPNHCTEIAPGQHFYRGRRRLHCNFAFGRTVDSNGRICLRQVL